MRHFGIECQEGPRQQCLLCSDIRHVERLRQRFSPWFEGVGQQMRRVNVSNLRPEDPIFVVVLSSSETQLRLRCLIDKTVEVGLRGIDLLKGNVPVLSPSCAGIVVKCED